MDKYTNERPVIFNKDLLREQCEFLYSLSLDAKENQERYRLLMGVTNLLYMIECDYYKVTESDAYGNTGIY
jgi:hypothetical protein